VMEPRCIVTLPTKKQLAFVKKEQFIASELKVLVGLNIGHSRDVVFEGCF
jgi:hypothetical protein